MFVRNNTTCPNCGMCNTFDMTFTSEDSDWSYLMRLECINCSKGLSVVLSSGVLCTIFSELEIVRKGDSGTSVHKAYLSLHLPFDSIKEEVRAEAYFVSEVVKAMFKPNTAFLDLTTNGLLGEVVNYFISKPDRKRRFRTAHLFRTVGL